MYLHSGRGPNRLKLLVIILNYNTTKFTIECLRSLESEIAEQADSAVVVVENGSGPEAADELRRVIAEKAWNSWVELIPLPRNLGYTAGNNRAMRRALESSGPPEYVLLLNSDTIVLPGAIGALVRFMDQRPTVGIAGSRLEGPDGCAQGSPFRFQGFLSELDRGMVIGPMSKAVSRWTTYRQKPSSAARVDWVAGASMILRSSMTPQVGLLDERFFAYFEDMDYCLSARRLGWETWYVPESRVVHFEGASSGVRPDLDTRPPAYWFQARRRYFLKNCGVVYTILTDGAFIAACALGWFYAIMRRRSGGSSLRKLKDSLRQSVFIAGLRG